MISAARHFPADLIFPAPRIFYQATVALPALVAVLLFAKMLVYRHLIYLGVAWWKLAVIKALSWMAGLANSSVLPAAMTMSWSKATRARCTTNAS